MKIKNLSATLIAFVLLVTLALPIFAHGGPPFIKINGKSTIQNATYAGSSVLKIPYESAPDNYLIGEKINFGADTNLLPVDPSIILQSQFTWDFADGTKTHPLSSSHTYQKAGSFIVTLTVKDPTYNTDVELESVQINILPDKNYSSPKAVIKVNGKKIGDPLKEPIVVTKSATLEFDASESIGKIKSYKWDFGDGSKLETGVKVSHTFKFTTPYTYSIFPLLRVEDEKDLINDGFVQLSSSENPVKPLTTKSNTKAATKSDFNYIFFIIGFVVFVGISFFLSKNFSKKKAAP